MNDSFLFRIVKEKMIENGMQYFIDGKVSDLKKLDDTHYEVKVNGTKEYTVVIDTEHYKKSTCDCPYTIDHPRSICKHKVAAYFKYDNEEYEKVKAFFERRYMDEEEMEKEYDKKLHEIFVKGRKKAEARLNKLTPEEIKEELLSYYIKEETEYEEKMLDREYRDLFDF